jgi:hypothetical protein
MEMRMRMEMEMEMRYKSKKEKHPLVLPYVPYRAITDFTSKTKF